MNSARLYASSIGCDSGQVSVGGKNGTKHAVCSLPVPDSTHAHSPRQRVEGAEDGSERTVQLAHCSWDFGEGIFNSTGHDQ